MHHTLRYHGAAKWVLCIVLWLATVHRRHSTNHGKHGHGREQDLSKAPYLCATSHVSAYTARRTAYIVQRTGGGGRGEEVLSSSQYLRKITYSVLQSPSTLHRRIDRLSKPAFWLQSLQHKSVHPVQFHHVAFGQCGRAISVHLLPLRLILHPLIHVMGSLCIVASNIRRCGVDRQCCRGWRML